MEALFIAVIFLLWLVPAAAYGQWWLFAAFFVFGLSFGILEYIAKDRTGMTVSQHFWEFSRENKLGGWVILICMLLGWIMLLIHLGKELV